MDRAPRVVSPPERPSRGNPGNFMKRFWDKWGLPALAVIIGSIILWGILFAPKRP